MSSAFLPPNEPPTDLTSDHIRQQILSEIEKARETCEDVPIVIGGTEYKTDNVKYQVVVSVFIYLLFRFYVKQCFVFMMTENTRKREVVMMEY